jgi:hypothetical protein
MKIGLNTDSLGALSLVEMLDHAAELGLDCIRTGGLVLGAASEYWHIAGAYQ